MSKKNKAQTDGRRAQRRRTEANHRRIAHRVAAANPVWIWCCVATDLCRRHGGTYEHWFALLMEFRPYREGADGVRSRWTIADTAPTTGEEVDGILHPYRLCAWHGVLGWNRVKRCHVVADVRWPGRSAAGAPPPDSVADVELCSRAEELQAAVAAFENAIARHRDASGTRVVVDDGVDWALEHLEQGSEGLDELKWQLASLTRRSLSAAAWIAART